jgi:transposase
VFSHLEAAGMFALVVNAFHVKNVPGRKTYVSDSEWLAQLARFGLLRGSFIPPKDLRELRVVSRYRRKLAAIVSSSERGQECPALDQGSEKVRLLAKGRHRKLNRKLSVRLIRSIEASQMLERIGFGADQSGDQHARDA